MTRPNPFECSYCGEPASERYYDSETGRYFASLCQQHLRHESIVMATLGMTDDTGDWPIYYDSIAPVVDGVSK